MIKNKSKVEKPRHIIVFKALLFFIAFIGFFSFYTNVFASGLYSDIPDWENFLYQTTYPYDSYRGVPSPAFGLNDPVFGGTIFYSVCPYSTPALSSTCMGVGLGIGATLSSSDSKFLPWGGMVSGTYYFSVYSDMQGGLGTNWNGNGIIAYQNNFTYNSSGNVITPETTALPTCFDGIQNQNETGIDTGGVCRPSYIIQAVCTDGIMNGDETGIDDGGRCDTHIIGFTPENGTTVTGPNVTFTMDVWVNPEDIGTILGVNLTLHNIDQNVLLLSAFSPSDIYLLDNFHVPSSGLYTFSDTRTIGDGNYRLNARLERSYVGGFILNPFSSINQDISKMFIVGSPTFIGTISQNGYNELNTIIGGSVAQGTTITAIGSNCNPFAGVFDVIKCMTFLFVPGGQYLNTTMQGLKDGVLTRAPWGYLNRVYQIWNTSDTGSFSPVSVTLRMGPGGDSTPETTTISFDPGDMITGAGEIMNDLRDPIYNKNAQDIFGPWVQLTLALAVLFTIISDLTGSHKNQGGDTGELKKKLS